MNSQADVNVKNLKEETPLNLAHKPDVIDFLSKNSPNNQLQDIDNFALNSTAP